MSHNEGYNPDCVNSENRELYSLYLKITPQLLYSRNAKHLMMYISHFSK